LIVDNLLIIKFSLSLILSSRFLKRKVYQDYASFYYVIIILNMFVNAEHICNADNFVQRYFVFNYEIEDKMLGNTTLN